MTLKNKLLEESKEALINKALNFAINTQPILVEEAKNGRTEYCVSIDTKNKTICASPIFLNALNELLDGVKVEVTQISASTLIPSLKKDVLRMSWGDLSD